MSMLLPLLLLSVADSTTNNQTNTQAPRSRLAALLSVLEDLQQLQKPAEPPCREDYSLDMLRNAVISLRRQHISAQSILNVVTTSIGESDFRTKVGVLIKDTEAKHKVTVPSSSSSSLQEINARENLRSFKEQISRPWRTDDRDMTDKNVDDDKEREPTEGLSILRESYNPQLEADSAFYNDQSEYDEKEDDHFADEGSVLEGRENIQLLYDQTSRQQSLLNPFASLKETQTQNQRDRRPLVILPFQKTTKHKQRPNITTYPMQQAERYPTMQRGSLPSIQDMKYSNGFPRENDLVAQQEDYQSGFQLPPTGVNIIINYGNEVVAYNVTLSPSMGVFKALYEARVNSYGQSSNKVLDYRIQSRPGCHYISRLNGAVTSQEDGSNWKIIVLDSSGKERYIGECIPSSSAVTLSAGYKIILKYQTQHQL